MIHEKVRQFYEFCTRMPKEKTYEYSNTQYCALGEFNYYRRWTDEDGHTTTFCHCDGIASIEPHTYAALSERLRLEFGFTD